MQQVVDLQNSAELQALDVVVLSIAFDTPGEQAQGAAESGITIPMLSDSAGTVSQAYGVLEWAVASGEPGHTFVLVDKDGEVAWVQDYGSPENRGVMYVPVDEIVAEVRAHLEP
jgi:peroxiredoxin